MKHYLLLVLVFLGVKLGTFAQTGSTCAEAQVITSLPFSADSLVTVGTTYGTLPCSSSGFFNYMAGLDYVFSYTPVADEIVGVVTSNTGTAVGLFITDLCPDAPGVACVANNNSLLGNPSVSNVSLTGGVTYYIIVSRAQANTVFDISMSTCNGAPVPTFSYVETGLALTFTNTTVGSDHYTWYFGDEPVVLPPPYGGDTAVNPTHTYTAYGTYSVSLITYNACGESDTLIQDITLQCPGTLPVADFTYTNPSGGNVQFTGTSVDATSYEWLFGDELFPLGASDTTANPAHTYTADGTYTVQLVAINECGNDTFEMQITVVVTGISSLNSASKISCYPNPASENLFVQVADKSSMEIIDIAGQIVRTIELNNSLNRIDIYSLAKGVYTLRIKNNNEFFVRSFIKQ